MPKEILDKFLHFIARNFMVELDEIPLDKSLIDEGIIDSFGLIEIQVYRQALGKCKQLLFELLNTSKPRLYPRLIGFPFHPLLN